MSRLLAIFLVILSGFSVFGQAPTQGSSNMLYGATYCNRVTLNWTPGNGAGRIIVARKASSVSFVPSDNVYYIARDTFGVDVSEYALGQFVVFHGSGNSAIIYGLEPNTTYYFAVYEYNGSGSTFSFNTSDVLIDSVTTAQMSVDFTIDDPHQCQNVNEFSYSPQVTSSSSDSISYYWQFGDGNFSNDSAPTYTYSVYGIKTVTLITSSVGCRATASYKDTIAPLPVVSFSFRDSLNNDTIQCFYYDGLRQNRFSFQNTTFVPYIGSQTDYTEIRWDFGDGETSTSNHVSKKTYKTPGIYRVVLTARAIRSKTGEACVDSAEVIVEVKPSPLDTNLIWFSDTSLCLNYNRFDFQNQSGTPGTSEWFFGDGNSAQGDSVQHSYNNPGNYEVLFKITDLAGCYAEFSDSVEVVPQPDNYFTGLDANYCQGDDPQVLTPNLSNGLFYGDNVNADDSTFNPITLGENIVNYYYEINGCKDTFSAATIVRAVPVFRIGNDTSICVNSSFDVSVQKDSSTLRWQNGSSDSFYTVSGSGLYWLEKKTDYCAFSDSFEVTVISAPSIDLGTDSTLCGGTYRRVNVTADEGDYVWSDGYVGGTRQLDQSGTFWVTVSNKCGSDQDTVTLVVLPYACEVYVPNAFSPNSDIHNPVFRATSHVDVTSMLIFDRWGELLYESYELNPSWDGTYKGTVVPTGTYFFQLTYLKPEGLNNVPTSVSGHVYVLY